VVTDVAALANDRPAPSLASLLASPLAPPLPLALLRAAEVSVLEEGEEDLEVLPPA
jgi:hypothetical protein